MRYAAALALILSGCSYNAAKVACAGAGIADAGTTTYGMAHGATEANGLLKPAPAALSLATAAVSLLAASELRHAGHETTAKAILWGCAIVHGGAALWNGKELSK